jgi:cold shock protein
VATGTVKSFNPKRHFGFIRPDSGGQDIFVHVSEVQRSGLSSLRKGQKISFQIVDDEGKPSARNLLIDGQKMDADKPVVAPSKEDRPKIAPEGRGPTARQTVTCEALQSVIAEAVKSSGPHCAAFVGVLLEKVTAKSPGDANWVLKGIKYGKSDRTRCAAALSGIVEQLQQEFVVLDEP